MPDNSAPTTGRPLAVVTGGSNGIGLELARELARNGHDLLLAAENPDHLSEAARSLSGADASVRTCAADLAREDGVETLIREIGDAPVDVLCVNAGVGLGGPFLETDLDHELRMVDLNVRGAVQLTKAVVKGMAARNRGRILFSSSIAATMPDPFEAVYGGTKVFLRWFGEALREELRDTKVGVTVLMPSTTETNFFRRADMMDTRAGVMKKDDPAVVARAAVAGLLAGKDKVVPTAKNKVMAAIADMLPERQAARRHRALSEPGSATPRRSRAVPLAAAATAVGVGIAVVAARRR